MHPSRGGKSRQVRARKTLPSFFESSSLQATDGAENVTPVQSPNHSSHRTPQTAPQERKSTTSKSRSSFTAGSAPDVRKSFSTPSPATSNRKRPRATDFQDGGAEEPEGSNTKGGHSLRKRARIDYSFEYIDDELGGRSRAQPRSTSRGRRRKMDVEDDLDQEAGHGHRRRTMDNWRADTSPRRKNPARKTVDQKSYADAADENDVLDTIEVGGRVQSDESPEQPEERRYRDEPASSPTPKEEPGKFMVKVPLPESLRASLAFAGLTKSPDLIEGHSKEPSTEPTEEPSDRLEEEKPTPAADIGDETGEKKPEQEELSPAPESGQVAAEREPEQEEPAPASEKPSVEIPSHTPKMDARSVTPQPEEAQPQAQEIPSEPVSAHKRRNSAPGKFAPAEISSGSEALQELSSRPWKEFEDLEPEDEAGPLQATAAENNAVKEAEAPAPAESLNEVGTTRTPDLTEAKPTEPRPIEPVPGPTPQPEPAEPPPRAEPVQSPEADVTAGTKEGSTQETSQETPESPPPFVGEAELSVEDQLLRDPKAHNVTIQTEGKIEPVVAEPSSYVKPWSHLTPHLPGQWTMHPESRLPQLDAARGSFDSKGSATPSSKPSAANPEPVVNGDGTATPQELDEEVEEPIESVAASPRMNASLVGSPVPDLNHATAASSPAAPEEDEGPDEAEEETPDEPLQTQRFYKYPRLRDPEEYNEVIQHFKDLSTEDLYEMCGFVDEALVALQNEYLMLGAIVDDYENIERRRAHDEAYEQLERRGDKVSRKTFVLKGYRAPMTREEKETAYQRNQDRVQAAAYGFRYDSHQAKVGKQDPILQRLRNGNDDGEPRRTLRSDPLRSAKATEAADETPAVSGKRVRRPREVFDPVAASRSSTPVSRRRRGKATDAEEEHANGAEQNGHPVNGNTPAAAQPEKPRRGRKRQSDIDAAAVAAQDAQESTMMPPPPPKRVRRASSKALQAAEENLANHEHQSVFPVAAPPASESVVESVETPRKNQRIVTLKTKAKNFGALAGARLSTESEERPRTASSTGSEAGDWARPKRRRKRDEEEEEYEGGESPKAKRARKVTKKAKESAVDNMLLVPSIQDNQFVEFQPHAEGGKSRKPRIKVVGGKTGAGGEAAGGVQGVISPAGAAAGANGEEPKRKGRKPSTGGAAAKGKKLEEGQGELSAQEYAALSKSEKMSHSMKSRWASGSMQQAVDKRKATLAKKKAARVAAAPGGEGSQEGTGERQGAPKPSGSGAA
ncbi:hypothetical protein VUR80DRAFT_4319 [Thermomyces stellatus]